MFFLDYYRKMHPSITFTICICNCIHVYSLNGLYFFCIFCYNDKIVFIEMIG